MSGADTRLPSTAPTSSGNADSAVEVQPAVHWDLEGASPALTPGMSGYVDAFHAPFAGDEMSPQTVTHIETERPSFSAKLLGATRLYTTRLRAGWVTPVSPNPYYLFLNYDLVPTFVLTLIAGVLMALIGCYVVDEAISSELTFLLAPSFGGSFAILYAAPKSPMATPRSLFIGHFLGVIFGLALSQTTRGYVASPLGEAVAGSLAVGLTIFFMVLTNTLHPPACSSALYASSVPFSPKLHDRGFYFLLTPLLSGCIVLFLVAWLGNNAFRKRAPYPLYW